MRTFPEITNAKLAELDAKTRPLKVVGGKLYYRKKTKDLRGESFTWVDTDNPKDSERAIGLYKVYSTRTLHTFGAPVFFKPSIAEVLAQLPPQYENIIVAYHVDTEVNVDVVTCLRNGIRESVHEATTHYYARTQAAIAADTQAASHSPS